MKTTPGELPAISFSELTKTYRLYSSPRDRLVEILTGKPRHFPVSALRGVSAIVPRGAVVGILGENGSGKSTLLKILAGTTEATSGSSKINGRVSAILELGSSFHPEVTGRRNAILQAALGGLSSSEVDAAIPEIEAFADLGEFFDHPVRTYSSGMVMRLAFAVATVVVPDILILDEALAVGDARFQKKCVDKIHDLRANGRTILFCSHALYYISTFCDRALWLRGGEIAAEGGAQEVVLAYEEYLATKSQQEPALQPAAPDSPGRIIATRLLDGAGLPCTTFRPGESWTLEVEVAGDSLDQPLQIHASVVTPDQVTCFVADSRASGIGPFVGKQLHRIRIRVDRLPLTKGEFQVLVFLGDDRGLTLYDAQGQLRFRVESEVWTSGLFAVPAVWEVLP